MPDSVSLRAFARLIGVDESAVRKAKKEGRISVLPEGTIDPEQGRREWRANTDPARTKLRTQPQVRTTVRTRAVRTEEEAHAAVGLVRRILLAEGHAQGDAALDYNLARTADTILKAHERQLRMDERRKTLVPLARVRPHIEKAFIGYRQAMQRLPSRFSAQIAAELGCEAPALEAALSRAIQAVLEELSAPVVRA